MDKQPIPPEAKCPNCGSPPENTVEHRLSSLGYTHDDISLRCEECSLEWNVGVPIGEPEEDDYVCDSCGGVGRVDTITFNDLAESFTAELKCPVCYYVWIVRRSVDRDLSDGAFMAVMQDPLVTGSGGVE